MDDARKSLADLTPEEIRGRAVAYREMAATASEAMIRDGLIKLAERLDRLAQEREAAPID
jgi:hypothetical protein